MSNDLDLIRGVIAEINQAPVEDDGLVFDAASVSTERIAEDADYEGVRAKFRGQLGKARIAMQVDMGFSDVVTPAPSRVTYPTILDQPAGTLMAYNRESAIAEKCEAMVKLGELNSRMKDFFDIWLLASRYQFDGGEVEGQERPPWSRLRYLFHGWTVSQGLSPIAKPMCTKARRRSEPQRGGFIVARGKPRFAAPPRVSQRPAHCGRAHNHEYGRQSPSPPRVAPCFVATGPGHASV